MMIRKAFILALTAGNEAEYKRRHDEIWPEFAAVLKEHGVHNYSISLKQETGELFGYVETEDEERWNSIAGTDICRKWWNYMSDIMVTNDDNSPAYTA